MDKIPYYEPPYPEETHYSHILRLARLNGFDRFFDFAKQYLVFDMAKYVKKFPHDSSNDLVPFFDAATPPVSYSDYILTTTSYSYHAMFMNERRRINIVNKMFMADDRFKYNSQMDKKKLCFCPDCMKTDRYYKRLHQIPVVKVCPIHHRPLYEYVGLNGHELDTPIQGEEITCLFDMAAEIQIAEFIQDFIHDDLDISVVDIQEIITEKINEFGGIESFATSLYDSKFQAAFKDINYIKYLIKNNIKREKPHEIELTIIMVYLFGSFQNFYDYYEQYLSTHENKVVDDNMVRSVFQTENYELVSEYRYNLITVKHKTCNMNFVTTPFAIVNGWMCPRCSRKLSNREFQDRMVQFYEHGEYDLINYADNLDDYMSIRHKECGLETHPKYIDFLFRGHTCSCKRRFAKADAEKIIKKQGDFELIKYTKASGSFTIRCSHCGNVMTYSSFYKDIKFRCNICNPVRIKANRNRSVRNRIPLSISKVRQSISDIVGDRYDVLDIHARASDNRYEMTLRHNECGREYTALYRSFLTGQSRCECESQTVQATNDELKRYISELSGGRYICVDESINRKRVNIQDTITGQIHSMKYWLIIQELMRPTPSAILPCDTKCTDVAKPRSAPMLFMEYLKENYGKDGAFFPRDIEYAASKAWIASTINMFLQQGLLKHIGAEIYTFSDIVPDWEKIMKLFYIEQNGIRHGCTYGRSFLQDLNIHVKHPPVRIHIMSNRKGRVTSDRGEIKNPTVRNIGSVSLRFKEAPCEITEENYKVLQVADYLSSHHNQNYPWLTDEEMDVFAQYIKSVPVRALHETLAHYPENVRNKIQSMWSEQ